MWFRPQNLLTVRVTGNILWSDPHQVIAHIRVKKMRTLLAGLFVVGMTSIASAAICFSADEVDAFAADDAPIVASEEGGEAGQRPRPMMREGAGPGQMRGPGQGQGGGPRILLASRAMRERGNGMGMGMMAGGGGGGRGQAGGGDEGGSDIDRPTSYQKTDGPGGETPEDDVPMMDKPEGGDEVVEEADPGAVPEPANIVVWSVLAAFGLVLMRFRRK